MAGTQHAGNDLPEASKACDDHMLFGFRRHFIVGHRGRPHTDEHVVRKQQERRGGHGKGHGQRQEARDVAPDHALEEADGEQHERELATLTEHDGEPPGRCVLESPPTAKPIQNRKFRRDQHRHDEDQRNGTRHQNGKINGHANGHEKHGQQQTLERRDICFDLVAIFGVGEQRAGDERAKRRRQPHLLHEKRNTDDRQQGRRGHRLAHAHGGDKLIKPLQQETPHDNHGGNGENGETRAAEIHAGLLAAQGEQRRQRDQRDGGEVLEQQHRECEPPVPGRQLTLLLQNLQGEGGRGERKRKTDEERLSQCEAEDEADSGKNQGRQNELRGTQSEDGGPHRPETNGTQLEADDEQKQDDAELAEFQNFLDMFESVEGAEYVRPDYDTRG